MGGGFEVRDKYMTSAISVKPITSQNLKYLNVTNEDYEVIEEF
jgi:hypothetical protein